MKILIVDDESCNRMLLKKMLSKKFDLFFAEHGIQAIELVAAHEPDLILMDVMMPMMDGIEATRLIREQSKEKWVPIIILSALTDEKNIVAALTVGADDYLTKPFNQKILYTKVNTLQRSIEMQKKILLNNQQLKEYQQKNETERAFTKDIFDQLIRSKDLEDSAIDYWVLPSKCFSGDLISIKRVSPERLYFIVADATGHGLAASMPTIIVNQVFQSMTEKQFLVSSIAKEINHRLRVDISCGKFVALAIGMLDSHNKTIEIWNGGIPELVVINKKCEIIHSFKSNHVSSGVLAENEFDQKTEIWRWTESCELFAYSDGMTDVLDKTGRTFGKGFLFETLLQKNTGGRGRIEYLQDKVLAFMDKEHEQDDISCLSIRCD